VAVLPRAARARDDPRALPRPDRPRGLRLAARATRPPMRCSRSCDGAWR
jgi:hypothetical protein